jgi:exopolyphosphatase/guanosine-5'-triphosphate,3'-diphosphate pyrophosphatase
LIVFQKISPSPTTQMKGTPKTIAALDIGSHTARLLVSEWVGEAGVLKPLLRKRTYIRLAKGFEAGKARRIQPDAIERTAGAVDDLVRAAREMGSREILAVATGIVREAENQERFLRAVESRTGIGVRVIGGEEEALLTSLGVLHGLRIQKGNLVIFDLGGGSTEFLIEERGCRRVLSLSLGAAVSTERYLLSDPPEDEDMAKLEKEVTATLGNALSREGVGERTLVGTGGTVTTLAATAHGIAADEISPERMNGLSLAMAGLEDLFQKMKSMTTGERMDALSMDQGRAEVIVAGCLIVLCILRFFRVQKLTVSVSDLLEGILINYVSKGLGDLMGGGDEKRGF